jgi:hypothetical protein
MCYISPLVTETVQSVIAIVIAQCPCSSELRVSYCKIKKSSGVANSNIAKRCVEVQEITNTEKNSECPALLKRLDPYIGCGATIVPNAHDVDASLCVSLLLIYTVPKAMADFIVNNE